MELDVLAAMHSHLFIVIGAQQQALRMPSLPCRWMELDVLEAMQQDPRFAGYATLDAEDDPGFLAFQAALCAEVGVIFLLSEVGQVLLLGGDAACGPSRRRCVPRWGTF